MKSYTLANWAGSPGRPEEKTSELPSTSLTGSSSTANSLSNTQSTSKYGGDTGDSGENVLISKDHELGWMDSSNIAVVSDFTGCQILAQVRLQHDASIHGMSLFETQANGTMLQPHHISTPSNQVQNASSSRLVTAQNQGPNNNDALRDAGFGLYKFSVPLHADVNYGRETQPSSTAYDVSNSKPYSNSARLTPNPLSSSSTVIALCCVSSLTLKCFPQINMSLEQPIYSPNRWFIPDLTSPLHSYKSPVEPRTSPLRDIPVSPSYKSISSKHAAGPPRPRTPEVEKIDMISVYTMDADGEDDDDDVIIVENMVANPSPEKSSDVIDMHESLFTPPPSQDGWIPLENIFTPPPESSKGLPTVRRIRMDYVQVPPLKRPRSDYKPMPRPTLPRPPTEKKKRPAKHVESHSDLARAMQAAYDNNESLGTLPRNPTMVKRKVAPKPDASLSRFSSQSVVVVKPQKPPRESTASSSRFSSVSLSASRPQHPPTTSSRLSSESLSASRPQKRRTGEDQPQLQANVSKRPRVTIDLTMSDAEGGQEKARPPKRPVARTSSSAGNNALQISIAIVRPTPPDVLLHNTRFLRQHLSPAVSSGIRNATGRDISNQRQNAAGAVVARPNPSRLSHYTSTPFPQGELSLGGFLEYGDDDTEDEESEDDDDIPLVDLISRRKASMAPSTSGRCESVVPIPSGARRDSVVPLAVPHSVQVQRRGPPSHGTRKTPSTARPPTARPASTARPTSTARPSNTGASASARQSSNAQQSSTRPSGAPVIHCQVEAPISALGFLLPGRAPPREHQFVHIAAHPAPRTASASSGSQVNGHVLSQLSRPKIAPSSSGIPIAVNKSAPSHPLPPTPLRISPGPSVISHAPSPPPRPASATPDLPATPAQPSPKALGKRRAVTPPPPPIPPPHPPPDYRSQQNSDAHLLQSTKGNLDIFLHDYSPAKSADGASTSAAAHFLDQGVLPSPFPSPTAYGRLTLGGLSGPSHAYQGSLLASPGSSRPVAFLSSTFDDEQRQLDTPDPWLQFIQEDTEYEFTTVDPTLLGDHAPVVALQAPAPGTVVEPAGRDASALFDSPQLFPSSISSSRASPMSDVFDLEYQPSASMTSASAPDRAHASLSPTASDFDKLVLHRTPPRKRMERVGEVDAAAGRLSPAGDATVTSEYYGRK
ncbi:hypothetical protein HYPSUDRAFT_1007443 [Hypholoma sublateritium FD-334 SS-4]|uniref:Uncharacterized protein n=1 Tax=Hypholoma sublateritium (strain FD-334 SS-4) TaxID=945553 RepID=A0A0D2NLU5_HYPSF|nr:hypothetical protein HYPSUDRAFT_1007443 [Hypholoma sublateritium FD-334 SS-4]